MKNHFYTHLVEIDTIEARLQELPIEDHERHELILIIHETIHHVVIDTVMTELSEEDKQRFLQHIQSEDHPSIWSLLKEKIQDIEEKIKTAITKHTSVLHEDIDEVQREHS